jgi:hypothetical protein
VAVGAVGAVGAAAVAGFAVLCFPLVLVRMHEAQQRAARKERTGQCCEASDRQAVQIETPTGKKYRNGRGERL